MESVFKQTFGYTGDATGGRLASFSFETFAGVGPMLWVEEHRGTANQTEAAALLWRLHRRNLQLSWLAGFPGMFPVISYLTYRSQLRWVQRQAVTGLPEPLPGGETKAETRAAVAWFVGVLLVALAGSFAWHWADPAGFAQFAANF